MNTIVPWSEMCAVIESFYPKGVGGRPPIGLGRMLRIHFVHHGFNRADLACEEALYDGASLRRFVDIDLGKEPVPDLLHGNERRVYGDSAYASQKDLIASKAPEAKDFTDDRVRSHMGEFDEAKRSRNRNKSRYSGLDKNATRAFTAHALLVRDL